MVDLEAYKTDYLFLLVGTNPLPNLVSALLLAKTGGKVILLHSGGAQGTSEVAENLKRVIVKKAPEIKVELREIDEKDCGRILKDMAPLLKDIKKEIKDINPQASVGLNYTGGTKAMSVHVYRAIKNAFESAVFSYLDARTLSLWIDETDDFAQKSIPVSQSCALQLREILSLHGYYYNSKHVPVQPDFCRILAEIHSEKSSREEWKKWLEKPDNLNSLPTIAEYPKLAKVINEIEALCDGDPSPDLLAQKLGQNKLNSCKLFLEGKWLEEYTFCSLESFAEELGLIDLCFNLLSEKPRHFELDVVFIRGYQLFALSCKASDNKKQCKLGLFEAFTRARQVGGDEAKIGLVCCYDDPVQLQREVEESWFARGQVRVFGVNDLLDLPEKLKEWIVTANNQEGAVL